MDVSLGCSDKCSDGDGNFGDVWSYGDVHGNVHAAYIIKLHVLPRYKPALRWIAPIEVGLLTVLIQDWSSLY
jgi:hypothetical protein